MADIPNAGIAAALAAMGAGDLWFIRKIWRTSVDLAALAGRVDALEQGSARLEQTLRRLEEKLDRRAELDAAMARDIAVIRARLDERTTRRRGDDSEE